MEIRDAHSQTGQTRFSDEFKRFPPKMAEIAREDETEVGEKSLRAFARETPRRHTPHAWAICGWHHYPMGEGQLCVLWAWVAWRGTTTTVYWASLFLRPEICDEIATEWFSVAEIAASRQNIPEVAETGSRDRSLPASVLKTLQTRTVRGNVKRVDIIGFPSGKYSSQRKHIFDQLIYRQQNRRNPE